MKLKKKEILKGDLFKTLEEESIFDPGTGQYITIPPGALFRVLKNHSHGIDIVWLDDRFNEETTEFDINMKWFKESCARYEPFLLESWIELL